MRFLGATVIWIVVVSVGYSASQRYVRRKELYGDFVMLIDSMVNDIKYFLKPISETVLNNREYIDRQVLENLLKNLEDSFDFPVSWQKAINDTCLPVTENEKKKIINFIYSLGKADFEVQINILLSHKNYFVKMYEKSERSCEKYSFTILLTSVLCGGAMFLMLI